MCRYCGDKINNDRLMCDFCRADWERIMDMPIPERMALFDEAEKTEKSERAQVVEDAIAEDAIAEDAERESFDSWRTSYDTPIPFEITPLGEEFIRQQENDARHCGRPIPYTLTEKAIAALRAEGRL